MKALITIVMMQDLSKALFILLFVFGISGCKKCYDCQFQTMRFTTYIVKRGDTTTAVAYGWKGYQNHESLCHNADTCWTINEQIEFTSEVCTTGDPKDVLSDEPVTSCVPK